MTALGEDWGFDVVTAGSAPFFYQWFDDGVPVPGATNSILTIPVVTNFHAGTYTVIVTNLVGRVDSEPATLIISEVAPRTLRNGNIASNGNVKVPMIFSGNGREEILSFSLKYDTNVFINPGWENLGTNSITGTNGWNIDLSQTSAGFVGLQIIRAGNFPATNYLLGNMTFDFSITNDPFAAMLQFTNTPTAFEALSTNFTSLAVRGAIIPQIDLVDAAPVLNLQSGLMEQQLVISYAGSTTFTNVSIAADNIGFDSLTNQIVMYNSIGTTNIDTTGYGDFVELPYADAGDYSPATQRLLTMEYYVTDRITVPAPVYHLGLGVQKISSLPAAATPLNITTNRYLNGTFVIQFPTIANYIYFVEYAQTLEDLINFGPTSRIVDPPLTGTGYSIQWIDNGPPKTESHPIDGMRFYRVVELPVN